MKSTVWFRVTFGLFRYLNFCCFGIDNCSNQLIFSFSSIYCLPFFPSQSFPSIPFFRWFSKCSHGRKNQVTRREFYGNLWHTSYGNLVFYGHSRYIFAILGYVITICIGRCNAMKLEIIPRLWICILFCYFLCIKLGPISSSVAKTATQI